MNKSTSTTSSKKLPSNKLPFNKGFAYHALSNYLRCPICQSALKIGEKVWCCNGNGSGNGDTVALNTKTDNLQKNDVKTNHTQANDVKLSDIKISNVQKTKVKNSKHSFDVARQGYVNLLPVQKKKSKHPGDSQESILARQRFLQAGFYQPLQTCIAELIAKHFTQPLTEQVTEQKIQQRCWLDVGCGEGYYSQQIAERLNLEQKVAETTDTASKNINPLIAIDISKPAVLTLAKSCRQQQILWSQQQVNQGRATQDAETQDRATQANQSKNKPSKNAIIIPLVASASSLPLADNSVQGVSSIFSPILPDELARVMAEHGILLIAKPDAGHLASVRAGLFDTVREHDSDKFLQQLQAVGFTLVETEKISTEFSMNAEQLADLLTMTPYSYRAKREKREALLVTAKEQGFMTEGRFLLYVLRLDKKV